MVDDGEITCSQGGIPYENGPVKCVKDCPDCKAQPSPAQSEQAEAERPEGPTEDELEATGLGYPLHKEEAVKLWYSGFRSEVITVLEAWEAIGHDIGMNPDKGELLDSLRYMLEKCEAHDAALARVAELERQEPVALANRGLHAFWVKWTEAAAGLYGPGIKLYAAPVAQAQHSVPVPVVTPEMVMAAMAVFRLDASPFKSMEAALIAALRKAAAPNEKRSCEYAGCCSTAHPGTSLCIAHHSKKVQEQLLAAAPGKEGV